MRTGVRAGVRTGEDRCEGRVRGGRRHLRKDEDCVGLATGRDESRHAHVPIVVPGTPPPPRMAMGNAYAPRVRALEHCATDCEALL